ncbi:MAG: sulfur carrier protein ThiS [Firmicutes bacterium]|nr:sulfur carrier protein ThiS [Bacillota bacterium]
MVVINGEKVAAEGIKLTDYLEQEGLAAARIAIEINEEILPKANYEKCVLKDGDVVEIVRFVGGG